MVRRDPPPVDDGPLAARRADPPAVEEEAEEYVLEDLFPVEYVRELEDDCE